MKLDLKTALQLSIQQYTIMAEGKTYHGQSKVRALGTMLRDIELSKSKFTWEYPVHQCFICQYVKDNYTDPGYTAIPGESGCTSTNEYASTFAWCALFCPMQGYLWGKRGCMKGDSVYKKLTDCNNYTKNRNYIKEMLLGFKIVLAKIEREEREHDAE